MGRSVVLIGPKCSEKTQTGKGLSELLKIPFVDVDEIFVNIIQISIYDFVAKHGIDKFREYESKLIAEYCSKYNGIQIVLKPGEGAVVHDLDEYREKNRKMLSGFGAVIYLLPAEKFKDNVRILAERMRRDPAGPIPSLTRKIHHLYLKVCDAVVYTEGRAVQEVAQEISMFVR